jgi:hypothetical protein
VVTVARAPFDFDSSVTSKALGRPARRVEDAAVEEPARAERQRDELVRRPADEEHARREVVQLARDGAHEIAPERQVVDAERRLPVLELDPPRLGLLAALQPGMGLEDECPALGHRRAALGDDLAAHDAAAVEALARSGRSGARVLGVRAGRERSGVAAREIRPRRGRRRALARRRRDRFGAPRARARGPDDDRHPEGERDGEQEERRGATGDERVGD